MSFLGYFYIGFLGTGLIFLGTFYRSWLYHICIYALSKLRFHFSVCPSKLITKAHCNIPAGSTDATAVGAVAFVGDILARLFGIRLRQIYILWGGNLPSSQTTLLSRRRCEK